MSKAITKENANTKSDMAVLLFANRMDNFRSFTALAEEMLLKYAKNQAKVKMINPITDEESEVGMAELVDMLKVAVKKRDSVEESRQELLELLKEAKQQLFKCNPSPIPISIEDLDENAVEGGFWYRMNKAIKENE